MFCYSSSSLLFTGCWRIQFYENTELNNPPPVRDFPEGLNLIICWYDQPSDTSILSIVKPWTGHSSRGQGTHLSVIKYAEVLNFLITISTKLLKGTISFVIFTGNCLYHFTALQLVAYFQMPVESLQRVNVISFQFLWFLRVSHGDGKVV